MPKPSVTATTTTTHTTTVTLTPTAKKMLKARCEEHIKLANQIKELEARQKRIRGEVEELFAKEDQDEALETGTEIDGHKVKRVRGTQNVFDKVGLMQAVGLTAEEMNAFYEPKPKAPYIKISAAGERDEEG